MSFVKLNARFPEDLWQIQHKTDRGEFNYQVQRGYDIMSSLSVCVVGLARNIEEPLKHSLARIDYLRNLIDLRWAVYTNDNDDKTREVLQDARQKHDKIIFENLDNKFHGSVECNTRYIDMAYYRNKYLAEIGDEDYILVLDLDTDGFSYDGLAQSFFFMEDNRNIDCIGSNSLLYREHEGKVQRLYYDTLAYRRMNREWCKPHPGEELNLMNFNRGERLVKVQSCFGGLALYRRAALEGKQYLADDCDHVTINRLLNNVYMNPSQIVLFGDNPYTL